MTRANPKARPVGYPLLLLAFLVLAPSADAKKLCGRMDVASAPVLVKVDKGSVACSTAKELPDGLSAQ